MLNRIREAACAIIMPATAAVLLLAGCGGTTDNGSASSAAATAGSAFSAPAGALAGASTAAASTNATSSAPTAAAAASPTVARAAPTTAATAATVSTTTAAPTPAGATTVLVASDPKLGQLLTDPKGMTLYWYTKDTPNTSTCTGACLKAWPAFSASPPLMLPAGVPGTLDTITRSDDGSKQVTYNAFPLYYWAKDQKPGDTTGQGVGSVWYVVAPTSGPLTPPK